MWIDSGDPDAGLVARARSGDKEALGELLSQYMPFEYAFLKRKGVQDANCEDILQHAACKVVENLQKFDGLCLFSTWLRKIVSNAWVDDIRKRKRESRVTALNVDPPEDSHNWPEPVNELQSQEHNERLAEALRQLPTEQRSAVLLHHRDGHTYAEIGKRLGIPEGTAKSRVHHALKRLKQLLEEKPEDQI